MTRQCLYLHNRHCLMSSISTWEEVYVVDGILCSACYYMHDEMQPRGVWQMNDGAPKQNTIMTLSLAKLEWRVYLDVIIHINILMGGACVGWAVPMLWAEGSRSTSGQRCS